jgi:hypothetical protein
MFATIIWIVFATLGQIYITWSLEQYSFWESNTINNVHLLKDCLGSRRSKGSK